MGNTGKAVARKPEARRLLERPSRGRESDIKIYLTGIIRKGLARFYLCQNKDRWRAFVNAVMHFPFP
jgi:hypothetical protein